jgi:putative phosphoesterase
MKIGVISDTHIPASTDKIPAEIFRHFKGVDLILHAGDLTNLLILNELRKVAPVEAVFGNMDPPEVRSNLEIKKIINAGKFRIGLIHGAGPSAGIEKRIKKAFLKDKVDVIVYGHTHRPVNKVKEGILFFNPGSPTDKFFAPYNSCGILEVGTEVKGKIIRLT